MRMPVSDQISINSGGSSQNRDRRQTAYDLPADILAFDSHEWVSHDDEVKVNKTMIGLVLSWKTEKCKNQFHLQPPGSIQAVAV